MSDDLPRDEHDEGSLLGRLIRPVTGNDPAVIQERPPYQPLKGGGVYRQCEVCGHVEAALQSPVVGRHACLRDGRLAFVYWT